MRFRNVWGKILAMRASYQMPLTAGAPHIQLIVNSHKKGCNVFKYNVKCLLYMSDEQRRQRGDSVLHIFQALFISNAPSSPPPSSGFRTKKKSHITLNNSYLS